MKKTRTLDGTCPPGFRYLTYLPHLPRYAGLLSRPGSLSLSLSLSLLSVYRPVSPTYFTTYLYLTLPYLRHLGT